MATDKRIEELSRALQEHLDEAAPALQLLKTHERRFQRVDTILRIAFCKTWQFVAAFLAGWLVMVEIVEHLELIGWLSKPR